MVSHPHSISSHCIPPRHNPNSVLRRIVLSVLPPAAAARLSRLIALCLCSAYALCALHLFVTCHFSYVRVVCVVACFYFECLCVFCSFPSVSHMPHRYSFLSTLLVHSCVCCCLWCLDWVKTTGCERSCLADFYSFRCWLSVPVSCE